MELLQQFIFNLKGRIQVSMIKYKRILNCNDPEMEMVETDWDGNSYF